VASKIPRSKLLGDSAKGINNGGEADERKWYDFVRNQQEQVLSKPLDKVIKAIQNTPGFQFKSDPNFTWSFKSLWQETSTQKADNYSKIASADAAYLDRGVIDPSQVAKRFEKEQFSVDLMVDADEEVEIETEEDDQIIKEIRDGAK